MTKVLLVDDNADSLWLQAVLLRKLGHNVMAAARGEDAIVACPDFKPDIVFVDVLMPEMDGHEVGRQIRELSLKPQPRIIAVTGYSRATEWDGDGVFDNVLLKPVGIDELKSAVK